MFVALFEELKTRLPESLQKFKRMDLLATLIALGASSSSITTVVGILLPSALSAPSYSAFRQFILGRSCVDAVVELPSELFRPYRARPPAESKSFPKSSTISVGTGISDLSFAIGNDPNRAA